MMAKYFLTSLFFVGMALQLSAQTAQEVLNKTANLLSRGAVSLNFSANWGSGTLVVQQKCFVLRSSQANIWFDGKTQWSNLKASDEVNVSQPTAAEIARNNPMNVLYLYKEGYKASLQKDKRFFVVHLNSQDKKKAITQAMVYVDRDNYLPKEVKYRSKNKEWTTIKLNKVKKEKTKPISFFRFNAQQYPKWEVIDLR